MSLRVRPGLGKGEIPATGLALLSCAAIFGGASQENALRLGLVELAALPMLLVAADGLARSDHWRAYAFELALLAGMAGLLLIQLVPLPYAAWSSLPGRKDLTTALQLSGAGPGWGPLSLTPEATEAALLALIPPAAMFLMTLRAKAAPLRWIAAGWIVAALAEVALGALQIFGPPDNGFYLYPTTNEGSLVGFFSNRNHLAAFLIATLPLAGALVGWAAGRIPEWRAVALTLGFGYGLLVVVAVAACWSRAGLLLLGPSLIAAVAVGWPMSGSRTGRRLVALGAVGGAVVLLGVAAIALGPILSRFGPPQTEGRFMFWPIIVAAIAGHLPFGAGVGAFDPVFRAIEPLNALGPDFLNHAHNDYLEVLLEGGAPAALALLAFAIWLTGRAVSMWRGRRDRSDRLPVACLISILLVLAHSSVDYPLRTEAMAVFFAWLCGVVAGQGRRVKAAP